MCKYTIHNYECGHKAEDHVDSSQCPEFRRTGVHCDRDNPANKKQKRVKIKTKGRNGVCEPCLRPHREAAETTALKLDLAKARRISLIEAKAHEEYMQRAEQRACEESLAQAVEHEKAQDARIAELERQSTEEYARKLQEQKDADYEFMLRKSREEADHAAQQQEIEAMQRAFQESMQLNRLQRDNQDIPPRSWTEDLGGGLTAEWTETKTTTWTTNKGKAPAIPNPPFLLSSSTQTLTSTPPPPPAKQQTIPVPPPLPRTTILKAPTLPPTKKPSPNSIEPKPVNYSIPAMGPQNIGRFKLGTRSQPIHPSQEREEPKSPISPISPSAPAPFARLGGQITPNIPPAMGQTHRPGLEGPLGTAARSGPRRTAGPRTSLESPEEPQVDAQLQALLAKRRMWEPEEDDDRSDDVL
ncbi:hypothetical protein IAQ61_006600 [Plenodomus lingam]|uniref:Predicted protein n=1 Tax=Leptosphaeria maculans (strain JN3 / isolate v23.1.3 / race Av1-4-5-6-7-8) TaxID=985895 RepID=E5AFM2_LEPMJ|nr:predicted protein [Plenodomus lingam JN3]KAH9869394.1 hypothetical protein IAQ61_006600 [Plenodomus lingam]CBY02011.1 predicted protein [Plenodomus lingam JN3]